MRSPFCRAPQPLAFNPASRVLIPGLPPPPEAFAPENHEHVQEVIFWRWCEADVETYGSRDKRHPHQGEWLAALRGELAS